jgi:hypothetical protein
MIGYTCEDSEASLPEHRIEALARQHGASLLGADLVDAVQRLVVVLERGVRHDHRRLKHRRHVRRHAEQLAHHLNDNAPQRHLGVGGVLIPDFLQELSRCRHGSEVLLELRVRPQFGEKLVDILPVVDVVERRLPGVEVQIVGKRHLLLDLQERGVHVRQFGALTYGVIRLGDEHRVGT